MSDLLKSGATWLASQLKNFASQSVTYQRGGLSVSLAASPVSPRSQVDENENILTRADDQDWIIVASDLVFGGSQTLPHRGDKIFWAKSSTETQVYEVLAADGEEQWSWVDPHQTMIRIHTKLLGTG